jgi:hypothetical protein
MKLKEFLNSKFLSLFLIIICCLGYGIYIIYPTKNVTCRSNN